MIACDGKRASRAVRAAVLAEVEATGLHSWAVGNGFRLMPLRLPRGLPGGNLRLRLMWKKTGGGETQVVRFDHVVTAAVRG